MVTWGPNSVREFNTVGSTTASPATPAAPATGFNFGGSTTSAAPAAPAGGFSFGSSTPTPTVPSPAATASAPTSAFGSSTFGSSTFGSSTFGSTPATSHVFGTTTNNATAAPTSTPNGLGAPQQAALQAHMNATFQQQSTRLEQELLHLLQSYQPLSSTPTTTFTTTSSCRFLHIFYNPMNPTQKLESQSLLPHYPPKPTHVPHLTDDIWERALSSNPNPAEYIPVIVSSAEGLHHRRVVQLTQLQTLDHTMTQLESILIDRMGHWEQYAQELKRLHSTQTQLKGRVLKLLAQVELCRGKNIVLQPAERTVLQTIVKWLSVLKGLEERLGTLKQQGNMYQVVVDQLTNQRLGLDVVNRNIEEEGLKEGFVTHAKGLLVQQGGGLDSLKEMVKGDVRDLKLIQEGLGR